MILIQETMPAGWTPVVAKAAWTHAQQLCPKESVGAIIAEEYVPFENVSQDPENHVGLKPEDTVKLVAGTVLVHSHPNGLQCPSAADMKVQLQLGIPFIILPIAATGPSGKAFAFGHQPKMGLLGRPFRHGVTDCYSLCRDYFHMERQLTLAEFPRDWEWWFEKPPLDMYRDGFASQGFQSIPITDATQPGDTLLIAIRSEVPQHAAIVINSQLILHHPAGMREYDPTRVSCQDLRSRWIRFAMLAVRHD